MTVLEIRDKVRKAEEAVEKIRNTIRRNESFAARKLQVIREYGWDENDPYCRKDQVDFHDSYWAICEYREKLKAVETGKKKLTDRERILQNWRDRLEVAMDKDRLLVTKVPECMKNMQVELVSEWDHFDMDRRKGLYEEYKKLGYREFAARHSRADMDLTRKTDAEIHKDNVRSAESLVVDLYVRINAVTGDVTDWSGIYYGGKALNGFVTGELGKVKVESIVAGGYNIQRKHVRVLVHEV